MRRSFTFFLSLTCIGFVSISFSSPQASSLNAPIIFTELSQTNTAAARLMRLEPGGAAKVLTPSFFSAREADVSFDGNRILFAGRKTESDHWQIYEMDAEGGNLRQVVEVDMDCRNPIYQSTMFVITGDEPWYEISFLASAPDQPRNLYSVRTDGTGIQQITFNPYGVADPYLMDDGRILIASRQSNRTEPGPAERTGIFGVNLDGADYAVFSATEGAPWKRMPTVTTSGLAVFVENDRLEPGGSGWLAAVTVRRNLRSHRRLTEPDGPRYHSPAPLPDGTILVSRRDSNGGSFAIVRFDPATGKESTVFDSPDRHDIEARLLAPRPEPDGRSSVVNINESTGILYGLNVYINDFKDPNWMPPGSAKRIRALEGIPRYHATGGESLPPPAQRVLGEVDIEADGSFNLRVPANIPIALQLLDKDGLALRTCQWIWVRNKEPRGCIGCHEDGELTPENRMVDAVKKPSISLTLPPERRRRTTYKGDIETLIEKKCGMAACHGGGARPKLAAYDDVRVHLKETARTSPLVWSLFGRSTVRPWDNPTATDPKVRLMPPSGAEPLTDSERRTILEWIDMGAELR